MCIFRLFNPAGGCYFLSSTYSATALPPLYPPNLYANDDIITTGNYLPIPYIYRGWLSLFGRVVFRDAALPNRIRSASQQQHFLPFLFICYLSMLMVF